MCISNGDGVKSVAGTNNTTTCRGFPELCVNKWMIEDRMTLLSLLGRIMCYFLLRLDTLFLLCMSLPLWSYFFHMDEVKTIVKSNRDAVKMVKGKVAEMMQNERLGGLDVLDVEFSKTLEFKRNNVAVYSI
ncbi:Protein phosphatase 1L [Ilyodon furcidens]|uniref:Protein phosphatase 1L n=1 Tax=Ilyodon furcidens TaxID=33524 RepID=A0ABV0TLZ2_9TELE